jgi:RNA-binding protein
VTELTSRQRSRLRSLAHHLDPALYVGRQGVTDAVAKELDDALAARELVKVKLAGDRDERAGTAGELARRSDAGLAGTVGRMAILYRRHPDPAKRKIDLGPP